MDRALLQNVRHVRFGERRHGHANPRIGLPGGGRHRLEPRERGLLDRQHETQPRPALFPHARRQPDHFRRDGRIGERFLEVIENQHQPALRVTRHVPEVVRRILPGHRRRDPHEAGRPHELALQIAVTANADHQHPFASERRRQPRPKQRRLPDPRGPRQHDDPRRPRHQLDQPGRLIPPPKKPLPLPLIKRQKRPKRHLLTSGSIVSIICKVRASVASESKPREAQLRCAGLNPKGGAREGGAAPFTPVGYPTRASRALHRSPR